MTEAEKRKRIKKGTKLKYIGENENAKGKTFVVSHKSGSQVLVLFPVKYTDGEIHNVVCYKNISDFEIIKG